MRRVVKNPAVITRRSRRLEGKDNVLVQNIEMPRRTISDRAAIERLSHENEIPFMAARDIDDVFPGLRRKALAEVRAQGVDAFAIESETGGGSRRRPTVLLIPLWPV